MNMNDKIPQGLEETQKCDLSHLTNLRRHTFEKTMLLDEATVTNLELFESQSGTRKHTLFLSSRQKKNTLVLSPRLKQKTHIFSRRD